MGAFGMTVAETVAVAGLLLNILIAVVGLTWGVSKIRDTVRREVEEDREKITLEINALRHSHDGQIGTLRRDTGEVTAALRQKITEVELFNRDTFMRRDSFYEVMKGYGADMRSQFEKIDSRLERMEAKIDSKS